MIMYVPRDLKKTDPDYSLSPANRFVEQISDD